MLFQNQNLTNTKQARRTALQLIDDFAIDFQAKQYEFFTDSQLLAAAGSTLVFDAESYVNYFLVSFKCIETKRIVFFEDSPESSIDIRKLAWVMSNFRIVGFNSWTYDLPICSLAVYGHRAEALKHATNQLILSNMRPTEFYRQYEISTPRVDHIDLIEVAPLKASLKIYAGRLHAARMQELPIAFDAELTEKEAKAVRLYNFHDLDNTALLFDNLKPAIELRYQLSNEYHEDLRSKSDAQIAEAVISKEIKNINGWFPKRPKIEPGTTFFYQVPEYIRYENPELQRMLDVVRRAKFVVGEDGTTDMPPEINNYQIRLGRCLYKMGIGGLHSTEKCAVHKATEDTLLIDKDVSSYYPAIILNLGLAPKHLGKSFLHVYREIVDRRLKAKQIAPKGIVEQSLKICINGSFGKLGSKYSVLYSPDLMIQVTVTGQLALLLLIEMIEKAGIPVVSANTDGMIVLCPKDRYIYMEAEVIRWQQMTGFETEETRYKAIYSRDVNNYVAITEEGKVKVKGAYTEKGSSGNTVLAKNPNTHICNDAVSDFLSKGIPVEKTIRDCKDIRRFVVVQNVKGGAEKSGVYLGRAVRWYYSTKIRGEINYVKNGNKVPNSENGMPLQDLPSEFPADIDYDRYIKKADDILHDIGFYERANVKSATLF